MYTYIRTISIPCERLEHGYLKAKLFIRVLRIIRITISDNNQLILIDGEKTGSLLRLMRRMKKLYLS